MYGSITIWSETDGFFYDALVAHSKASGDLTHLSPWQRTDALRTADDRSRGQP